MLWLRLLGCVVHGGGEGGWYVRGWGRSGEGGRGGGKGFVRWRLRCRGRGLWRGRRRGVCRGRSAGVEESRRDGERPQATGMDGNEGGFVETHVVSGFPLVPCFPAISPTHRPTWCPCWTRHPTSENRRADHHHACVPCSERLPSSATTTSVPVHRHAMAEPWYRDERRWRSRRGVVASSETEPS